MLSLNYNIKKITEDVIAGKVRRINLSSGEIEELDIPAKGNPMIQAQVKPWVDQQRVLGVFHFADTVVKYLITKLDERLKVGCHHTSYNQANSADAKTRAAVSNVLQTKGDD